MTHPIITHITQDIIARSSISRIKYLNYIREQKQNHITIKHGCGNIAHACAVIDKDRKTDYISQNHKNIGIITAYNDMLSAHYPFKDYPDKITAYAKNHNMTVQIAAGVPAMCDGVTQGTDSMELSLLSRDNIAQAAAVGLSHNVFHGVVYLGVCDKIVPALLMAGLRFGHLPSLFIPAGPMPTGLSNPEKVKVRNDYAQGLANADDLMQAELKSYHTAGTCTFYGTANSNQLLLEVAGLHLPHTTFIPPFTSEREKSIQNSVRILANMIHSQKSLSDIISEKTIVNMMIALIATGGSTNLTIHLIAIARMAGIIINWDDFDALAKIIPLITNIYPSGDADINDFHKAGGVGYVIKTLLHHGLLHHDVQTIIGDNLSDYASQQTESKNKNIIRDADMPFSPTGGLVVVSGNLGRGIIKISAVDKKYHRITAPAKIFYTQDSFKTAFQKGELNMDCVVVMPYQGGRANGMPELHHLMPALMVLQNRGFKVALVTDGRLSGASGKVLSSIHICPEAQMGGNIGKISDGDIITIDAITGYIHCESAFIGDTLPIKNHTGMGRELFDLQRNHLSSAEEGATFFSV